MSACSCSTCAVHGDSMLRKRYVPVDMVQGETPGITFTFFDPSPAISGRDTPADPEEPSDWVPRDVSGFTFQAMVRREPKTPSTLAVLDVTRPSSNSVRFALLQADADTIPPGHWFWDARWIDGAGRKFVFARGPWEVAPGVTR